MSNINWEILRQLVDSAPDKYDRNETKKYISPKMKKKIWERDKVCKICGRIDKDDSVGNSILHMHHINPKGESTDDNLVLLCKHCHQAVHCLLFALKKCCFVNVLRVIRW